MVTAIVIGVLALGYLFYEFAWPRLRPGPDKRTLDTYDTPQPRDDVRTYPRPDIPPNPGAMGPGI